MKGERQMERYLIFAVFLFNFLFYSGIKAEEASELPSETDRISYSLGHQIGSDFKRQGVELDAAALGSGFKDANSGAEPAIDPQEMETILGSLKSRITSAQRESVEQRRARKQREAEEKRTASQKYLAENSTRPGVKTLPSGLQYRVIRSGTGEKPVLHDLVKVQYRARLIDGHEFDSSYRRDGTSSFRVGGVIPGWTEALQLMREGDKWEITIPPELAFGSRGPLGNQTLIYEIELLEVGGQEQSTTAQAASSEKS